MIPWLSTSVRVMKTYTYTVAYIVYRTYLYSVWILRFSHKALWVLPYWGGSRTIPAVARCPQRQYDEMKYLKFFILSETYLIKQIFHYVLIFAIPSKHSIYHTILVYRTTDVKRYKDIIALLLTKWLWTLY